MGLRLEELTRRFDEVVAVDHLELEVPEGELLTLLGPSGCGKTTALRLVAGFERPDAGRIVFRDEDVTARSPQRRGFGMVFQNYALFPHLSVDANVAYGLRARRVDRTRTAERVEAALARVNLAGYGERRVQALSGGQQQRVALARALAVEPPLLLLDEPLSNLDAALRERTRAELRQLVKQLGITAIFVTHDQEEAFELSDRIAVLSAGRLRQVGTPEDLYQRPADPFVATFVGRANTLPGDLTELDGRPGVRLGAGAVWQLPNDGRELPTTSAIEVVVRPEDLELATPDANDPNALEGRLLDARYRGAATLYRVQLAGDTIVEVLAGNGRGRAGESVAVRPGREARLHIFPAERS